MSAPATSVHTAPLDLGVLRGKTLVAWAQASDYWHMQVDVQDEAGACYSFTTDDQMPGPLFEVFALQLAHGGKPANPWQPLKRPFRVAAATPLWRTEWLEPLSEAGDTLGHAPHVHHAGRGPAAARANRVARVRAGAALFSDSGEFLVISTSDAASFNVEIHWPDTAVAALADFEATVFD